MRHEQRILNDLKRPGRRGAAAGRRGRVGPGRVGGVTEYLPGGRLAEAVTPKGRSECHGVDASRDRPTPGVAKRARGSSAGRDNFTTQ